MTATNWIALATLWFLSSSAVLGGVIKATLYLSNKIGAIQTINAEALAIHERREQEWHGETAERLTRLETLIIQNGHSKKRKTVAA